MLLKKLIIIFFNYYFSDYQGVSYAKSERVTYPCSNCGKIYAYLSSLVRHKAKECGVEPKYVYYNNNKLSIF